ALTTNNADEAFIKKLNSIINTNIDNPQLDVAFLMQEMAISRTPLYNKIKALTCIGVNDYINNIRIAQAKELLAQTDKSITEISDLTGFSYQRYFSTIFKQATGVSPSQYRNNIRGEAT
ncbi:MAG: AraC family transcriptional regulator, partial [Bacteroides sp.]